MIENVTFDEATRFSFLWATTMLVSTAIVLLLLLSGLRIAQEYQRGVVLRLGRYVGLRGPGLCWCKRLQRQRR